MIQLLRRTVFTMAAGIALAGCAPNAERTQATVTFIDRSCEIIRTAYDEDYKKIGTSRFKDSCNSIGEWDKVRTKRNKVVDGKAVVHISYTAPQNGQPQNGELTFDGRDDEFYQLKAGDRIDILVSNADPTRIQKA
jgi:hypothetical protein